MRVLVLGGGYAGLVTATRLESRLSAGDELLLVDSRETHLIRHQLHRLVRRPALAETIQIPFDSVLEQGQFLQGTVTELDTEANRVELADGTALDYDAAAVTFGASVAYFGLDSVAEHSIPLDTPTDALAINERVEQLLAAGEGSVVVGGGGLAGIQVAGEIAQARWEKAASDVSVTIVEQESSLAPRFDDAFRGKIAATLESLDVTVRTGAAVTGATPDSVHLDPGAELPSDLFVWTGGLAGREPFGGTRPEVRADLRLDGTTFAGGDAVDIVDVDGTRVTPSAQTAIRQGPILAANLQTAAEANRSGTDFRPRYERFRDETFAWVASVGDEVVAQVGSQILTGPPAKALKSTVGVGYLSTAGAVTEALDVLRSEFGLQTTRQQDT